MPDSRKTKAQLLEENAILRWRIAELESQHPPETDRLAASTEPLVDALRPSEKFFQTLMTALPEAITLSDLSGKITYANPQTARVHGYEQTDALLGSSVFDLIAPAQRQQVTDRVRDALVRDAVCRLETELIRSDGSPFSAELFVTALRNEQGVPQAIVGITRDITEHKRMEDALRASEVHFRAVVEDQAELIYRYRPNGTLTFVNEAYCRTFGLRREDLLGQSFLPLMPEEDQALVAENAAALSPHNPTVTYEHRIILPDGDMCWQQRTDRALYDTAGNLIEFQSVSRDVTKRKRIEQELADTKAMLEAAINQSPVPIALLSAPDDVYRIINPAMREYLGVQDEPSWVGLPLDQLKRSWLDLDQHDKIIPVEQSPAVLALQGIPSHNVEGGVRRKDSTVRSDLTSAVPIYNSHGQQIAAFVVVVDITARKRLEEALRASEQRLELALEAARAGVWEYGRRTNRAVWSDVTYRLLGYEPGSVEISVESWLAAIHPDDRAVASANLMAAIGQQRDLDMEFRVVWPDESVHWLRVVGRVTYDDQGEPLDLVGLQIDVTESRKLATELQASEEKFRSIIEQAGEAIALFDEESRCVEVNAALERLTGVPREEWLGLTTWEISLRFLPPAQRTPETAARFKAIGQAIAAGQAAEFFGPQEYSIHKPNGENRSVRMTMFPIRTARGNLLGNFLIDITDRKQAEEALHETTASLRATFDAFPDLFFRLRADGVILDYQAGAQEDLHVPPEVFLGKPIQSVMPPPLGQLIGDKVSQASAQHRSQTLEYTLPTSDGKQYYEARFVPIAEGLVVAIVRNITEHKQAEEQIRRLNSELEQRVVERTMELQTVNAALHDDIRQRQRIEEMLRRSEQRYRTLFDSAGDAIFIVDLDGQVIDANRMASQQLGYSHDELKGLPVSSFDASPEVSSVTERIHRLRLQGEQVFEALHQRRDGSRLPVEIKSAIIEYDGSPAILGIVRDITERKRIAETQRRSEASLAEAQRIAHFGSWTWDLATGNLQCSDEMFRLVGLRPQGVEVTQEVFLKFLPPDEVEAILQRIQNAGTSEPSTGLEHQLIRSNGERRTVYSRVKVYRDEHGNPLRLLGSTQDITDRKRAEQALRQYADEQSALYEIALRLSAQLNTHELLQLLVEQAVALLGMRSGGLYLYDAQQDRLVLAPTVGFFSEYVGATLKPGEGLSGQAFQTRQVLRVPDYEAWEGRAERFKSDRRLKSVIAVPLLGRHSVLGVLIMADYAGKQAFSDHAAKLAELFAAQAAIALENAQLYERQQEQYQRLQDAQTRLIQSEKMSALGRLIASISHEINNPLQAIQGCLTLIRESVEEELPRLSGVEVAPWLRDLEVASTEVQRIAAIVQRLRDFYRPTRPGLQATDVTATIDNVLMLTAKQLQHSGITVEQTTPAEPPIIVNTNADQLKQIILNLVLNAIDAMPGGGILRVTAMLDTLRSGDRARPMARLDFTDTGHGIPPENLPRIFEPFFTTKDTGSGLGLSISYELVKALGGDLNVTSQEGIGTTFIVRLPLEPDYEAGSTL